MNSIINKITDKILNTFFPNETKEKLNNIIEFLENNELYIPSLSTHVQQNSKEIKFNRQENKINIPGNFWPLKDNRKLLLNTKRKYGENAFDVMISHEFGHSVQYRFLRQKEGKDHIEWNMGKSGDMCFTKIGENNTNTKNAENFFKVDNSKPTGIERFMQQNFMESYADCYSGLIVYLKNSDSKSVFKQIKDYRSNRINDIKNKTGIIPESEMIIDGKFAITEYSNTYGVEKLKDNFIDKFSKNFILNLTKNSGFEAVHHIIQTEVLDGLYKTMKEEAKSNPLFLLELKDFCKNRHNSSINDFFKEFENHIDNIRQIHCIYTPINKLDNGMPFYDYDKESANISKTKIIEEYKQTLSSDGLKKFNELGINDIILNQFPENYGKSNYDIMTKINNKFEISQNIFSLREKAIGQKEQVKSNLKL